MKHRCVATLALVAALGLGPRFLSAADIGAEALQGRLPYQCSAGSNNECACDPSRGDVDCPGGKCAVLPLKTRGKGVLTIMIDDMISDYQAIAIDQSTPVENADELQHNKAFTVLLEVRAAGRQRLLAETYQNLFDAGLPPEGDKGKIEEQLLVSKHLQYLVAQGALKKRLQDLFFDRDPHRDAQLPVLLATTTRQPFENQENGPLATVVSSEVKVTFAQKGDCGVAPTATPTASPTPTATLATIPTGTVTATTSPTRTATATPTQTAAIASATITATPTSTATATFTGAATPTSTVTQTGGATASAKATPTPTSIARTGTPAGTATPTITPTPISIATATRTATPIPTSPPNPAATFTPAFEPMPEVTLSGTIIARKERGNDTYVRYTLQNSSNVDLGRIPYVATFTVEPAGTGLTVKTQETQGRPVFRAGYKDYVRVGITTDRNAPPGDYTVIGVFRFKPSALPLEAPPLEIKREAIVTIE